MSNTANLALPFMPGGASEGYVSHNKALFTIDALLQGAVINRTTTAPPAAVAGDCYIPKATATGVWASHENHIAYYDGSAWKFYTPEEGWTFWCAAEKTTVFFNGTSWRALDDAVFGAHKSDGGGSQSLSSSFAGITFNTQSKYNSGGVYTHSTSSNPEQITLNETGDYEVSTDITFDATSGTVDPCEVRLSLAGSAVNGATSYTYVGSTFADKSTVSMTRIISAVAGNVLSVEGRVTSGGAQALAGGCRVTVRKLS